MGSYTDLLRPFRELFNAKLFVEVRPDQKVVYSCPNPDERIRDADNDNFLVLFRAAPIGAVRPDRCCRGGGCSSSCPRFNGPVHGDTFTEK